MTWFFYDQIETIYLENMMKPQYGLNQLRAWTLILLVGSVVLSGCQGWNLRLEPLQPTATSTEIMPSPTATWTTVPTSEPTLTPTPQTVLAATGVPATQEGMNVPTAAYNVLPVLFVPKDLTPNVHYIIEITRRMEQIQRWYAEQLRGITFTLEPVVTLIGTYERDHYYQPCFPPVMACDWGYALWDNISRDVEQNMGMSFRDDRVIALFIQNDGMGGTALGGGNIALNGLGTAVGDCLTPGCMYRLNEGGLAHELGHAFGLPHTEGEEYARSIMGQAFYDFPRATVVNSDRNPEIDILLSSPFMNHHTVLKNGGFEDCLDHWFAVNVEGRCSRDVMHHSGEQAVEMEVREGGLGLIRQEIDLEVGLSYDITGWVYANTGETTQLLMDCYDLENALIETVLLGRFTSVEAGWEKMGGIYTVVPEAVRCELVITGDWKQGLLDDLAVTPAYHPPVRPLPLTYLSGDAFAGSQIPIQWSDVPNAPMYQFQLDNGSQFTTPILDLYISSPFYMIPEGFLEPKRTYKWRVRAGNGAGWSEWSPEWQIAVRSSDEYIGEEFQTQKLDSGWKWADESQANWSFEGYIAAPGDGFISIRAEDGALAGTTNNVKSILLREAPAGDWAIGTRAELWVYPYLDGQQGGLIVHQDDDNYMTMVHSFNQGYRLEWTVEVDGEIVVHDMDWSESGVPMRIERRGNTYTAWYSYDGVEWLAMPNSITVDWSSPQVGLTAFGPQGDEWVTAHFDYFRFAYPE